VSPLDREVVRLLMYQVREEQAARHALVRALIREEALPVLIPTDEEVNARILELQEVARQTLKDKNNLTNQNKGSSI
jgi:hypothetical protein